MMQDPEMRGDRKSTGRAKAALGRVAKALSDPETRKSFKSDPRGTVQDYEALPESVRQTLEDLTIEQLDLLAYMNKTFVEAGLYVDVEDEYGGGRVFFF